MEQLKQSDALIYEAIRGEIDRENYKLELIASENFVSVAVLEALGCVMTNKYAEGYPGHLLRFLYTDKQEPKSSVYCLQTIVSKPPYRLVWQFV